MKRILVWGLMLMVAQALWAAGSFEEETAAWRARREAALRKPDGWLTLAGLYWLDAESGSFGSADDARYRFPSSAPAHVGSFHVEDGKVVVDIAPGVDVRLGDAAVHHVVLDPKAKEGRDTLSLGSLSWYVIERDGRLGIRLKDSQSPVLAAFHGLEYYPAEPRWRIAGHFTPYDPPHHEKAPSALGTDMSVTILGVVTFEVNGEAQHLEVYGEPGDAEWSIIFGDRTNHHGSYPAGRYLDVPPATASGDLPLDFNRAYNPPCAFTPYATCVYPPPNNRLPLPIAAGERFTGH